MQPVVPHVYSGLKLASVPHEIGGDKLSKITRIWQSYRVARLIFKVHGGFSGLSARVLRLWREEGVAGMLARLGLRDGLARKRCNYLDWVGRHDTPTDQSCSSMAAEISRLDPHPLISLVLVGESRDEQQVLGAIESVKHQIYPYWQLWIASCALPMVSREYLHQLAAADSRIRIDAAPADSSMHAANAALMKVAGQYVVFLDGKGKLSPIALYWVAREIVADPGAGFIYCDEDMVDRQGRRSAPHFKPDWNPDLFLTWDYAGPFKVFRTALARQLGGFRAIYGDSQTYDFALRAVEHLNAAGISHIPRILYHGYLDSEAGAHNDAVLSQKTDCAGSAVRDHLERLGVNAVVREADEMPGCLRVRYTLPVVHPGVTLLIPTRNGLELLRRCLGSIWAKTNYASYDIIVIDNGSDDLATLKYLDSLHGKPGMQVIRDDGPFNFSRLNNLAAGRAKGSVLGLLNNDLEVINADWLSEMVSQSLRPEIGIVGARLWYPDDTIQHAGVILTGGVAGHVHKGLARGRRGYFGRAVMAQNFVAVTAACMVVRKNIYEEVGGLDEEFAVAFNDIDLCLRVGARGYRNLWTPYAQLYHHESASRGNEDTPEKMERFMREVERMQKRWGSAMFTDPAYNPNLDSRLKDFSLAWPPNHFDRSAG